MTQPSETPDSGEGMPEEPELNQVSQGLYTALEVDRLWGYLDRLRSAYLSLREREGMVLMHRKLLESAANMMEYGRCIATDDDAASKFAFFRDQLRPAAPSAGGEKEKPDPDITGHHEGKYT